MKSNIMYRSTYAIQGAILRALPFLLLLVFVAGCDSNENGAETPLPEPRTVAEDDYTVTDSGLKYYDFTDGSGDEAGPGDLVQVHYHGWLESGELFDSSVLRGQPIVFELGQGFVIDGWEEGLEGMRVGGERQLVIPPELGYGSEGSGSIPPEATLIFEVALLNRAPADAN
jgi:FKBP-type peptidyl-prolyl cis-trans isomerase FkpA